MDAPPFDLVDGAEQLGGELDPSGAGALKAAVLGGQAFEAGPIRGGDGVQAGAALFTAAEDPGGVQFCAGAMAGGFAALGAQPVERTGDHGEGELEAVEKATETAVIGPELLTEFGERYSQCLYYII